MAGTLVLDKSMAEEMEGGGILYCALGPTFLTFNLDKSLGRHPG